MIWDVRLAKAAAKQLEKLPPDYQTLLLKKLNEMRDDPFQGDVQLLKGKQHQGRYRKRVGRYRIIFTPDHDNRVVEVSAILPRDEKTYR
jgi:mRNA-degrading endonuclease RelE of RelBE toxin-antitoxin system